MTETVDAPFLLGIAGPSGSGKSTIAAALAGRLGAVHLTLDSYYRDHADLSPSEREQTNMDDPAQLDEPLLCAHLAALARGESVAVPVYDFATHTRKRDETVAVCAPYQSPRMIICEGNFALHFSCLRRLYQFSVFVQAPDDLCFARRLERDHNERGRSRSSIERQYAETVRPMAERYILPTARHAGVLIDGAGEVQLSVRKVLRCLEECGINPVA